MNYKIEEIKKYRGYEYTVIALDMGHRCGYVKIPPNHSLYEKEYDSKLELPYSVLKNQKVGKRGVLSLITAKVGEVTIESLFNVHGSITFAGYFKDKRVEGYWIGFDCAHAGDGRDKSIMSPINLASWKKIGGRDFKGIKSDEVGNIIFPLSVADYIWTQKDVEKECQSLIRQIIKYFDK